MTIHEIDVSFKIPNGIVFITVCILLIYILTTIYSNRQKKIKIHHAQWTMFTALSAAIVINFVSSFVKYNNLHHALSSGNIIHHTGYVEDILFSNSTITPVISGKKIILDKVSLYCLSDIKHFKIGQTMAIDYVYIDGLLQGENCIVKITINKEAKANNAYTLKSRDR